MTVIDMHQASDKVDRLLTWAAVVDWSQAITLFAAAVVAVVGVDAVLRALSVVVFAFVSEASA